MARDMQPPNNIEAEESFLGAMLIDTDIIYLVDLVEEDFYLKKHGKIFAAAKRLSDKNIPIDQVTIAAELAATKDLDLVGGPAGLTEFINVTPTSVHAEYYAGIIKQCAAYRRIIAAATKMAQESFAQGETPEAIIANGEKVLFGINGNYTDKKMRAAGEVVNSIYDRIDKIIGNPNAITGLPTGLSDIDKLTGGLRRGSLYVIAARPGMGKTALATQIAINAAMKYKAGVLVFSLEMAAEELMARIISPMVKVESRNILDGKLTQEQHAELISVGGQIRDCKLTIEDSGYITPVKIRNKALQHKARHGLDLIIIDYLQILNSDVKTQNRTQEVGDMSRACKQLARECNVPVVLLSQLNRGVESRADKRPMLSDLRESGAIEADADQVWFIYRDDVYNKTSEEPNVAELNIAKQRSGIMGKTIKLFFDAQFTRFADLALHVQQLDWERG